MGLTQIFQIKNLYPLHTLLVITANFRPVKRLLDGIKLFHLIKKKNSQYQIACYWCC